MRTPSTKSRKGPDLDNLTTAEVAREIRRTMARLAQLQALLVEWSSNAEEVLETVMVEPVEAPTS
jgi:hypothetical protein